MDTIERGDVEDITDRLNPRALTKCKTNTLYMAMKVDDIQNPAGKAEDANRDSVAKWFSTLVL